MHPLGVDVAGEEGPDDLAAEGLDVVDLILVGGRALDVDGGDVLGPHGVGAEADVHAGIAGAKDDNALADGGTAAVVDLLEKIESLDQALVAGEGDDDRVVGAAGDDDGVALGADGGEAGRIDLAVGADLDADGFDPGDLAGQYVFRQTFRRDDLTQLAADFAVGFVDGDGMAGEGELPGGGETARAAADDRDLLAAGRLGRRRSGFEGEAAELLHRHRMVDEAAAAGIHAEVGADLAADRAGEGGVAQNQFQRLLDLPLTQQVDAILGRDVARA